MGPTFEQYLTSKKIDSQQFREAEPDVWESWKLEFEQMHPNSFTVQKLNLINPVRRKYQLPLPPEPVKAPETSRPVTGSGPSIKPGRPVIKPRTS